MKQLCTYPPLCYNFNPLTTLMSNSAVKAAIGTTNHQWSQCNSNVYQYLIGDWYASRNHSSICTIHAHVHKHTNHPVKTPLITSGHNAIAMCINTSLDIGMHLAHAHVHKHANYAVKTPRMHWLEAEYACVPCVNVCTRNCDANMRNTLFVNALHIFTA